jgi:hypothetical protein
MSAWVSEVISGRPVLAEGVVVAWWAQTPASQSAWSSSLTDPLSAPWPPPFAIWP